MFAQFEYLRFCFDALECSLTASVIVGSGTTQLLLRSQGGVAAARHLQRWGNRATASAGQALSIACFEQGAV
jgi:hypothetical protein